jgi:hypothetical protein
MSRGVLALFGPINSLLLNSLQTFTDLYNVPYITWSEIPINSDKNKNNNYQFYLQPDLGPTLVSLVKHSQWKNIYYIYNYDEGII